MGATYIALTVSVLTGYLSMEMPTIFKHLLMPVLWTTIALITGQNGGVDNHPGLTGSGRYVRIYVRSRSSTTRGVYLAEF